MEPSCPLQVLSIRSSLPHLRVIVLYGDEEVPAEVTKQYHMSPEPFEHPICPSSTAKRSLTLLTLSLTTVSTLRPVIHGYSLFCNDVNVFVTLSYVAIHHLVEVLDTTNKTASPKFTKL